jgi:drug/metabolite transporter (DMT)-like permease
MAADDDTDMDDELTRLLAEGKTARARQILSRRGGTGTTGQRSASALTVLLLVAGLVAVVGAVIYGMSYLGLRGLQRLQPVLDPIVARLAPSLLSPAGLVILGLLILAIGLPRARRFRRPARSRGGVLALAAAFSTFWPLQFLAARIELPFPEWSVAVHLLSGFISICLLTGGLEAIRMANNTTEGDSWEFLN